MLVYLCLPLLNKVMVLVMLSLFCGSNAAFPITAQNLLRQVANDRRDQWEYEKLGLREREEKKSLGFDRLVPYCNTYLYLSDMARLHKYLHANIK